MRPLTRSLSYTPTAPHVSHAASALRTSVSDWHSDTGAFVAQAGPGNLSSGRTATPSASSGRWRLGVTVAVAVLWPLPFSGLRWSVFGVKGRERR